MKNCNTKVLVTYDSKLGSTAEIAKFMGRVLSEKGSGVAVKPLSEVDDLGTYDSVIIGSAIRYDRWLPKARTFVRETCPSPSSESAVFRDSFSYRGRIDKSPSLLDVLLYISFFPQLVVDCHPAQR